MTTKYFPPMSVIASLHWLDVDRALDTSAQGEADCLYWYSIIKHREYNLTQEGHCQVAAYNVDCFHAR